MAKSKDEDFKDTKPGDVKDNPPDFSDPGRDDSIDKPAAQQGPQPSNPPGTPPPPPPPRGPNAPMAPDIETHRALQELRGHRDDHERRLQAIEALNPSNRIQQIEAELARIRAALQEALQKLINRV